MFQPAKLISLVCELRFWYCHRLLLLCPDASVDIQLKLRSCGCKVGKNLLQAIARNNTQLCPFILMMKIANPKCWVTLSHIWKCMPHEKLHDMQIVKETPKGHVEQRFSMTCKSIYIYISVNTHHTCGRGGFNWGCTGKNLEAIPHTAVSVVTTRMIRMIPFLVQDVYLNHPFFLLLGTIPNHIFLYNEVVVRTWFLEWWHDLVKYLLYPSKTNSNKCE